MSFYRLSYASLAPRTTSLRRDFLFLSSCALCRSRVVWTFDFCDRRHFSESCLFEANMRTSSCTNHFISSCQRRDSLNPSSSSENISFQSPLWSIVIGVKKVSVLLSHSCCCFKINSTASSFFLDISANSCSSQVYIFLVLCSCLRQRSSCLDPATLNINPNVHVVFAEHSSSMNLLHTKLASDHESFMAPPPTLLAHRYRSRYICRHALLPHSYGKRHISRAPCYFISNGKRHITREPCDFVSNGKRHVAQLALLPHT